MLMMEGFTHCTHPFNFFPTTTKNTPFSFSPQTTVIFASASKDYPDPSQLKPSVLSRKPNPRKKNGALEYDQSSSDTMNLVRPVPKKGVKFDTSPTIPRKRVLRASPVRKNVVDNDTKGTSNAIPNVALRKPAPAYPEDDIETYQSSRKLNTLSNLSLTMKPKESVSDIPLLKKPEPVTLAVESKADERTSGDSESIIVLDRSNETKADDVISTGSLKNDSDEGIEAYNGLDSQLGAESVIANTTSDLSTEAALQGKPQRLDKPSEEGYQFIGVGRANTTGSSDNCHVETTGSSNNHHVETEDLTKPEPLQEQEYADWTRAENLFNTGRKGEMEVISCSSRGFVGSFGSLIGFLPYQNLGAKWKFLAFESWLREKGLDPAMYKQNLGIFGGHELQNKIPSPDSNLIPEDIEGRLPSDMKLEDLLRLYDQEKTKFLSSFIGQKIKVAVASADRNSRKLMFSVKPKQKEEVIARKRRLMDKLSVGDVVKCCIKKIAYFGIFAEVEGVPTLIPQSEVSWDATLDPSSFIKIGEIVDAKVHQLDFTLERITLSLKEITPDPLNEALKSVVGDGNSLDGGAGADVEWDDVESLIKQLQQIEEVQSVSKGRFFLSPGLAPTFQVYMASMFDNQYKLLARSANKVQEVIVQASLDKEAMKAAILTCTNRVE